MGRFGFTALILFVKLIVVKGCKGHLPEHVHLELLGQLQDILPSHAQAIFLGDGEFDGIELQAAVETMEMRYVCQTAKKHPIV